MDQETHEPGNWQDDVLNRKIYADFLTAYLRGRVVSPNGDLRSFTLAIDADWGSGKSFFVERWARDLRSASLAPHPAAVFNAWSADFASDPLMAFMAAFKAALDEEVRAAGLSPAAQQRVRGAIGSALKGLRRALLPTAKQIVKGVAKTALGVAIDEISEAYSTGDLTLSASSVEALKKGGLESVNKSLDGLFAKALEEQAERSAVIANFRASIEMALEVLVQEGNRALPMFVFVDELDRCRPSFAIALLEGVKHLFGVKGVCFVVSTHLAQLAQATRAVYGPTFDGRSYLKRFFDIEFALPPADARTYARLLFKLRPLEHVSKIDFGFPANGFVDQQQQEDAGSVFAWVASAFQLTLRDQEQVFEMVSAAAPLVQGRVLCLLWLTILCAIRHRDSETFETMAAGRLTDGQFGEKWSAVASADVAREQRQHLHGQEAKFRLGEVARIYYRVSNTVPAQGDEEIASHDYPRSVQLPVLASMPFNANPRRPNPSPIQHYYSLVRSASHFVSTAGV